MLNWDEYKKEALKDDELYEAYQELEPEYKIIKEKIKRSVEPNLKNPSE